MICKVSEQPLSGGQRHPDSHRPSRVGSGGGPTRSAPRNHNRPMCETPSLVLPLAYVFAALLDVLLHPLSYSLRSFLEMLWKAPGYPSFSFGYSPRKPPSQPSPLTLSDSPSRLAPGRRTAIAAENAQHDIRPDMQVAIPDSGACAWCPPARVVSSAVLTARGWPQHLAPGKAFETDLPFDSDQVHRHSVCVAH